MRFDPKDQSYRKAPTGIDEVLGIIALVATMEACVYRLLHPTHQEYHNPVAP